MAESGWKKRLARGERGQSLVEMTIGFIILLVIVSGLLDLGRAYFTFVALEDGAGEAALYAAINPSCFCASGGYPPAPTTDVDGDGLLECPAGGSVCPNPDNAEYRARNSGGALVDWTDPATIIEYQCSGSCEIGDRVDVTISYPYELLTSLIPQIAGANSLTLSAHASQNIIGE